MPELPDVEIFKRYFDSTGLHQKISETNVLNAKVLKSVSQKRLAESLKGRKFESTCRRGKFLFVETDGRVWLVLHFGMTGGLQYYKGGNKSDDYERVRFTFDNGYHLGYISLRMLGRVSLTDSLEKYIQKEKLGPDVLTVSRAEFKKILEHSRGAIKSTLMNQKHLAGLGNIYSDEILFQSGIHPKASADSLDDSQRGRLFEKMRAVLDTAIDRDADPKRMPRTYLLPRRGKGGKCPRCDSEIETIKVSQRTTYFCSKCQKKP